MSKKILLADDSITTQRVVELTFAEAGYQVTCVGEGGRVLHAARDMKPDLVLLDVSLPEVDGYDVCRALREEPELQNVPVMMLTGTFEPFDRDRARDAGASGHLTKPFESQVLIDRVAEMIAHPVAQPVTPEPEVLVPDAEPAPPESEVLVPDPAPPVQEAAPVERQAPSTEACPPEAPAAEELSPETLDAIARRVVEQLGDRVVRDVAWEVVPDLAERLVKQRLRQIEEEAG